MWERLIVRKGWQSDKANKWGSQVYSSAKPRRATGCPLLCKYSYFSPSSPGKAIRMTIHRMHLSVQLYLRNFFSHRSKLLFLNKLFSAPTRGLWKAHWLYPRQLQDHMVFLPHSLLYSSGITHLLPLHTPRLFPSSAHSRCCVALMSLP